MLWIESNSMDSIRYQIPRLILVISKWAQYSIPNPVYQFNFGTAIAGTNIHNLDLAIQLVLLQSTLFLASIITNTLSHGIPIRGVLYRIIRIVPLSFTQDLS